MRASSRILRRLQTRSGAIAFLLVLTTGLLIGYYGWLALVSPPLPTYRLDFGRAQWIQASEESNNVCFRKDLYLSATPRYAWIEVTACDAFKLYINGRRAGVTASLLEVDPTIRSLLVAGNETVICDITHYLVPGTNTIAINVTRGSYPGRSKLLSRGGIIDSGKFTDILSDTTWKVALTPGTIPALMSWTDPAMDDSSWAHAEVAPLVERANLVQPVPVPPTLLQEPIKGQWIVDKQPRVPGNTTFKRHFDSLDGSSDAWLQIASNGGYTVILNNHLIGDFNDTTPIIQLLHVKRWLRGRNNELLVQTRTLSGAPAIVAEISFLSDEARAGSISSDENWTLPDSKSATAAGSYNFNYSGDEWGFPPKMNVPAGPTGIQAMREEIWGVALMITLAAAIVGLWGWWSRLLSARKDWSMERSLGLDAALHLPALVTTATLLLLRYDIRLRPDSPINVGFFLGIIALLISPRLLPMLWTTREERRPIGFTLPGVRREWISRYGFFIALGVIVLASLIMRVHGLTTFPLDQDDILIRNYAMGILKRGYPSLDFYGFVIPITTYELLPYPIALSCIIFGWVQWAIVLPALICGVLTTLLIGLMARNLFDWRVGLVAALIHAFDPLNVFWAQHCFHPSQDQFFAVITIWLFYLAIKVPGRLHKGYFYACCVCYVCEYLTWEGVAFLLPILAAALMLMYPGRWRWLLKPYLWFGLIAVSSVVLIQLSLRKTVAPGFLFLGYGLASLGGPQPYFLNPESMPFFYISSFLLTNPHLPLTILGCASIFFVWQNRPLRYCVVIFLALLAAFSLCMPIYSIRYFYFYQFLLIMIGSAVFFILWDRIRELLAGWRPAQILAWISGAAALCLVVAIATETGLRLLRLSPRPEPSLTYGSVRQDTRTPAEFVVSHLRPGDIVLANLTQAFYLYGHRMPDYALNTLLGSRMIYLNDSGDYRHRFVGIPMIRNLRDVHQVFDQARRIWYIGGGPIPVGRPELKDALDFVTQNAKILFSGYHTKVFLWDGTTSTPRQTVANPALPPQPKLATEQEDPLARVIGEADDSDSESPIFVPHVNSRVLYPQWTHQSVAEPVPGRQNVNPRIPPLQPPPKPAKPDSDEHPQL